MLKMMIRACGSSAPPLANPGVLLGLLMGVGAVAGRDKLTISADAALAPLGPWLEQLVAESRIPVVQVWDRTPDPIDMLVGFDHSQLGTMVAEYFLGKGHDRFACVFAGDSRAQTRMRGFADRVREAGGVMLRADTVPAPSTIQLGREFMRALAPRLDIQSLATLADHDSILLLSRSLRQRT